MSQAKKKVLKRKVAQIVQHQLKSLILLNELQTAFGEFHDDYAELFELIGKNVILTTNMVQGVSVHAWGYFPDDFHTWLK